MKDLNLFEHHFVWEPFARFGFTGPFWQIYGDTLIYTWVVLAILIVLSLAARRALQRPNTVSGYLAESYARAFMNMITQSIEHFEYRYFAFIGSLFTYILFCNLVILIPFMEEPTKDLNTTLACAVIAFLYVQKEAIKAHGLKGYILEFFKPFFLLFPLEVLGKLATIVSLSFRLFGNIFGGSIIATMWNYAISGSIIGQIAGIVFGINLIIALFFGIFEGVIQAFVFSVLSLTYLSMAIAQESHE